MASFYVIKLLLNLQTSGTDFFPLDLQMEPVDFAKKMRNWSRRGFAELGDMGGMGIGRTTYHVLHHPNFLTDPHQV